MEEIEINVINKLTSEKRDLNVYHHSKRSAYMIGYGSSISLPLEIVDRGDYLYISIVCGPGNLEKDCLIDMPSWMNFKFFSQGNFNVVHAGNRTLLEVPRGAQNWQLKLSRSMDSGTELADYVRIGES
ncbi:MAG: hypothetical protein ACM3SY_19945 [Candidatus Omnitrophota bacterium]